MKTNRSLQSLQQFMNQSQEIERKFVKIGSISSNLRCPICFEVFQDARRAFCGHTFCRKCLDSCYQASPNCPQCRNSIDISQVGEDMIANAIIDELEVMCPIDECPWKGQSNLLHFHFNYECVMRKADSNKKKKKKIVKITPLPTQNVDQDVKQKINQNIAKGSLQARVLSKCFTHPPVNKPKVSLNSEKSRNSELDFLQQLFE